MYLDVNLGSYDGSEERKVDDASGVETYGDQYRKASPLADRSDTN